MSVKIRLTRIGKNKAPYYRIVVADSRSPRDGKIIEKIGHFAPMLPDDAQRLSVNKEKAIEWLKNGAQPSPVVFDLFRGLGITKEYEALRPKKSGKRSRKSKRNSIKAKKEGNAKKETKAKA